MKKFNKITPEGTKDILFEECLSQRTVSERLTHINPRITKVGSSCSVPI